MRTGYSGTKRQDGAYKQMSIQDLLLPSDSQSSSQRSTQANTQNNSQNPIGSAMKNLNSQRKKANVQIADGGAGIDASLSSQREQEITSRGNLGNGSAQNIGDKALPNETKERLDANKNMAKYLEIMAATGANRGIPKTDLTPQQQNGLWPQNPHYFNVQPKPPIPYDQMIGDGRNLAAVLKGYQTTGDPSGGVSSRIGNIVQQVQSAAHIIGAGMNTRTTESLYAGVPKSAAVNLYQINLRNTRENDIYSFV